MSNTPFLILPEVAAHLDYDTGPNGSRFTANPFGSLPLTGKFFERIYAVIVEKNTASDLEKSLLTEIVTTADASRQKTPKGTEYGVIPLSKEPDSLWQRVCTAIESPEPQNLIFGRVREAAIFDQRVGVFVRLLENGKQPVLGLSSW